MLARARGLTAGHVRAIVAVIGDLERLSEPAARRALHAVDIPAAARAALVSPDQAAIEADVAWLGKSDVRLIDCLSPDYPPLLGEIPSAPAVLFVLGEPSVLASPQLAMVGSRSPTAPGRATAREFATYFSRAGLTITSGLALGIDTASHEGALLAGGSTIAVCGTGLDRVYPPENEALAARICERGALVSEFPPRTPPLRSNFPRRNRIISGLSLGVLVVEAARDSGSLSTARHAGEQGREVFAIPGSIHNPLSRGCHKLIRDGAQLVEDAADVLTELKFSLEAQRLAQPEPVPAEPPPLDKDYEMLLDALGFEPTSIDVLVERTGLPGESIASMLLILELQGRVAPHPGGLYCRMPTS